MPNTSTLLGLPYIQPSQAQKHVTHNEALRLLDTLTQPAVISLNETTPPTVSQPGDRYVVGTGATGDWAGQAGALASRQEDGAWLFLPPQTGWTVFVTSTANWAAFDGATWSVIEQPLPDQIDQLGVNATADSNNRLSIASDATLLNHDGNGHQLKINKNQPADTASALFQSGFSGRAEMGLAGDDTFSVKVSADGSTWATALNLTADGVAAFPSGGVRAAATGPVIFYVDPVSGSDSNSGLSSASSFATVAKAVAVAMTIDANNYSVTIQLADGTHALANTLSIGHQPPGCEAIIITGNPNDKTAVTITGSSDLIQLERSRVHIEHLTMTSTGSNAFLVIGQHDAQVKFNTVVFGASGGGHISLADASGYVTGACTIAGNTGHHFKLKLAARLSIADASYTLASTPNFSIYFLWVSENSIVTVRQTTFSGAATGARYIVFDNACLSTREPESYLPGNVGGIVNKGGRYT